MTVVMSYAKVFFVDFYLRRVSVTRYVFMYFNGIILVTWLFGVPRKCGLDLHAASYM